MLLLGHTDLVPLISGFDGMLPSMPSSGSSEPPLDFFRLSSVPGRLVLPSSPVGRLMLRTSSAVKSLSGRGIRASGAEIIKYTHSILWLTVSANCTALTLRRMRCRVTVVVLSVCVSVCLSAITKSAAYLVICQKQDVIGFFMAFSRFLSCGFH